MQHSLLATIVAAAVALYGTRAAAASDQAFGLAAGLGLASPSGSDVKGSGSGGYAEVEYIYRPNDWFTPRAYTGVLLSSPKSDCGIGVSPCDVSANIFFLGGKVRLMAPIPYIGPFIEVGVGASAGRISTRSGQAVDAAGSGIMYHVPLALGLAMGEQHRYELSFQYLYHPEQKHVCGAVAVGVGFDL